MKNVAAYLLLVGALSVDAGTPIVEFVPQPQLQLKGFWAEKLDLLEKNWIPHCWKKLGVKAGAFQRNLAEATMLALERHPERGDLADILERYIQTELAAQAPDGYVGRRNPRYQDFNHHEFYGQGYFLETAVRHLEFTRGRDRRFFEAGKRLVDHLDATFGPSPKRTWTDGHPGLEKALLTFGDALERWDGAGAGRRAYELARYFIRHQHDVPENRHSYCQSDVPATQMKEACGHAVRATYFYAGLTGTALRCDDEELKASAARLFSSAVDRKQFLTGGVGARWSGEAFGKDFSLGNERAYAEGCAACGMYDWCTEKSRLSGVDRPEAVRERLMYNALLGVFSEDFTSFSYQNPPASSMPRSPWHTLPCCSGNVPRVLEDYKNRMYAVSPMTNRLHLLHFIASTGGEVVIGGVRVGLDLETDYPRDGKMKLRISSSKPVAFDLVVREPNRTESALYLAEPMVSAKGRMFRVELTQARGCHAEVAFELPMPVQKVTCAGLVTANRGLVAEQQGPLVTSFEGPDFSRRVPYYARLNRGGACRVWLPADGSPISNRETDGDFFRGTGQPLDAAGRKRPKMKFLESPPSQPLQKFSIDFEKPVEISAGGYGRVRSIGDGRYALVYSRGGAMRLRTSVDGCRTWSGETTVAEAFEAGSGEAKVCVFPANAEILRLKSGRILYPFNWRPKDCRIDRHPFAIALTASEDGGTTWCAPKILYRATNTVDGVTRGCYEPFVEEKDGSVRIYFADESPYVEGVRKFQNISFVESRDNGTTWSDARVYCYKPRARDGMPVALDLNGYTYMAIESNGNGTKLHPEIVRNDGVRMAPLLRPGDWRRHYAGAPYLVATENFLLLSYQTSVGSADPSEHFAACEVVAMPKSEMRGGLMQTFRGARRPIIVDQTKEAALWNALCPLGGDAFLVVSQFHDHIYLTRGHVDLRSQ